MKFKSILTVVIALSICTVATGSLVSLVCSVDVWSGSWDSFHYFLGYLPDKEWKTNADMSAWIDVVGYNHSIELNGTKYVVGNILDSIIVDYEVEEYLSGSESRWNDNVDWISENVTLAQNNTHMIATLDIVMKWHHSKHNGKGIKKTYHYSYLTCVDTEPVPLQYNISTDNFSVNITIYNNTLAPKTYVYVPENDYILEANYYYNNKSISHIRSLCDVRYTEKNVPYVNITECDIWSSNNLTRINKYAVIPGDNFTIDNLTVTILTPEGHKIIDHCNISVVEYDPENVVHPAFWLVIVMVIILVGVVYKCINISF
jgi:hypothetical protein